MFADHLRYEDHFQFRRMGKYAERNDEKFQTSSVYASSITEEIIDSLFSRRGQFYNKVWNKFHQRFLCLEMLKEIFFIGYADDTASIFILSKTEGVEIWINQTMGMLEYCLDLATRQTEIVLFTKEHINIRCYFSLKKNNCNAEESS